MEFRKHRRPFCFQHRLGSWSIPHQIWGMMPRSGPARTRRIELMINEGGSASDIHVLGTFVDLSARPEPVPPVEQPFCHCRHNGRNFLVEQWLSLSPECWKRHGSA